MYLWVYLITQTRYIPNYGDISRVAESQKGLQPKSNQGWESDRLLILHICHQATKSRRDERLRRTFQSPVTVCAAGLHRDARSAGCV